MATAPGPRCDEGSTARRPGIGGRLPSAPVAPRPWPPARQGGSHDAFTRGQRAPDPRRPGHAHGRDAAPLLDAGAAGRELPEPDWRARARPAARRGPDRLPRHAAAASACSTSSAPTAAPRSSSAATRSAGCAASTTAGSSTSTGRCVDMMNEPEGHELQGEDLHHRVPDARGGRGGLGLHGPAGAQAGAAGLRVDCRSPPPTATCRRSSRRRNWLQAWRAASTPRTRPSCTACSPRHGAPRLQARQPVRARQARRRSRWTSPTTATATPASARSTRRATTCGRTTSSCPSTRSAPRARRAACR